MYDSILITDLDLSGSLRNASWLLVVCAIAGCSTRGPIPNLAGLRHELVTRSLLKKSKSDKSLDVERDHAW